MKTLAEIFNLARTAWDIVWMLTKAFVALVFACLMFSCAHSILF